MHHPNLANLTTQYQQTYLVYCYKIMQYLHLLAWMEQQQRPQEPKVKPKSASGVKKLAQKVNQEKLTLKSLKHQGKSNVSTTSALVFPNGAMSAAFRVAFNERVGRIKPLISRLMALGRIAYGGKPRFPPAYPISDMEAIFQHLSTIAEAQGDNFLDIDDPESNYLNQEREMLARVAWGHTDKYTASWYFHEISEASMVKKLNNNMPVSNKLYLENTAKAHKAILIKDGDNVRPFNGEPNRYHPLVYARWRSGFSWNKEEYNK